MEDLTLRAVRTEDAEAIAALDESLDYPATAETVRSRLEALALCKDRTVLAAVSGGEVVGWIFAYLEQHLQSEPVITIGGLVVREDLRGHRIGVVLWKRRLHRLALAQFASGRSKSAPMRIVSTGAMDIHRSKVPPSSKREGTSSRLRKAQLQR